MFQTLFCGSIPFYPPLLRSGPGGASRHSVPAAFGGYSKLSEMPYIFSGFITSSWKRLPTNEIPNPFLWFLSLLPPAAPQRPRWGIAALRAGRLRRLLQALRNALHFLWFYYIFLETFANKLNSKLFFTVPYFPLTPASEQACSARLFLSNPAPRGGGLLRRQRIVLSPEKIIFNDFFLPPKGAAFP